MAAFDGVSLEFENYKSFGPGLTGFNSIAAINLVIGRNNSGKSALLDLVEFACKPAQIPPQLHHQKTPSKVILTCPVTERSALATFPKTSSGGPLHGHHYHWDAGQTLIGARIEVQLQPGEIGPTFESIDRHIDKRFLATDASGLYIQLASNTQNPFKGKLFYKLAADRDITVEQVQQGLHIDKTGRGFTSTIAQILNRVEHPTELVADSLLDAVNEVFSPDASFTSIDVQQHGENGPWEIFLNETGKGRIALTHSGSGLKTILLAASYFLVLPHVHNKPLSEFIFAFEELENNLHPALQRRLLRYVTNRATKGGVPLFLTTHSNVLIDLFSNNADAQIIHVTQTGGVSQARRVQTYVENRGILDDLDVRASDLLQANGIVWVEGPSDRLYFNRWIALESDDQLKEGVHYQCVFYGGRLLAHLSANVPGLRVDDVVQILRVNRNALILIDSDKGQPLDELNETKKRIIAEIESLGGVAWVTQGRAVENYLPLIAVKNKVPRASSMPERFVDFAEYLDTIESGAGKRFSRNKVLFAEAMLPSITKESFASSLDLVDRLRQAVSSIRKWNAI
jgi:putative ATP-dependent endonuclease of the OLD family